MKRTAVTMALVAALVLTPALMLQAVAQPGPGGGPPGGPGGPPPGMMGPGGPGMGPGMMGSGGPGMMMPPPPMPTPVVVIGDGVVYVACDGKLMAFEAKTLRKLGEAIYWERPEPPQRPQRPEGDRPPDR
jgi:hypothetical protein